MRCEACRQLLEDFIDRELPEAEIIDIEQHLVECVECRRELEFLHKLSREAASLPNKIEPERNLWPGIESAIQENSIRPHGTAKWLWRIAAAALLGSIVFAGSYLMLHKQPGRNPRTMILNASSQKPLGMSDSHSTDQRGTSSAMSANNEAASMQSSSRGSNSSHSASLTYSLDQNARVFTSNQGVYAVLQERDDKSLTPSRNYIVRFDEGGMHSWTPPLPPGSKVLSIYPGPENQLWICWGVEQPGSQIEIAELYFGVDSQIKVIWRTGELFITGFAVSPQGLIYASGFRNDLGKSIAGLTRGQSITSEIIHIIDPKAGNERHLLPITLRPTFDLQAWAGQTLLDMTALASQTTIAVRSNGNFFVTLDRTAGSRSVGDLFKNETLEYSPRGAIVQRWELNSNGPDWYLNKIFIDMDDSILAEGLTYPDSHSTNEMARERYFLRLSPNGRVTNHNPAIYSNEIICGWIGEKRQLVTIIREGRFQKITFRNISF